jgi:hypothetical protein
MMGSVMIGALSKLLSNVNLNIEVRLTIGIVHEMDGQGKRYD